MPITKSYFHTDDENSRRIYETILQVPKGRVSSYGMIADLAGLPGRARLVGRFLRLSKPEWQLPWHRIVRADGRLAFAQGSDQALRQRDLLENEGVSVNNNRVNMKLFRWQPVLAELMSMKY